MLVIVDINKTLGTRVWDPLPGRTPDIVIKNPRQLKSKKPFAFCYFYFDRFGKSLLKALGGTSHDIAVWTSAEKLTAAPLVEFLETFLEDKKFEFAWYREHCTLTGVGHASIKDLDRVTEVYKMYQLCDTVVLEDSTEKFLERIEVELSSFIPT